VTEISYESLKAQPQGGITAGPALQPLRCPGGTAAGLALQPLRCPGGTAAGLTAAVSIETALPEQE
jgi:hypothetical protein